MEPGSASPFVIVSSPGMHDMAAAIQKHIGDHYGKQFPHYKIDYTHFANGEILPVIPETVRGQHVFFLHPLQHPDPNAAIVMMLLACDAMKRAAVHGITLVIPYIPYLRQDRKDKPRVPISARMLADLIESNRQIKRVITVDMHAEQEQGFFSISVDNLTSAKLFAERFRPQRAQIAVVSPDFGGAVRARRFAALLDDVPVAIFEKRRPRPNVSEVVSLIGEPIEGKVVLIYDDMIDTGGTIRGVVTHLREQGAAQVHICATHGVFSGGACESFASGGFSVIGTDSIPRDTDFVEANKTWLSTVSLAGLLADAVFQVSLVGGSVSKLLI